MKALAAVFPQDRYPFPRDDLRDRWKREIHDPHIGCYVIEQGDRIAGFVAVRGDELLHFGVAVDIWGSGLASVAHDETIAMLANNDVRSARLRAFEANKNS